MDYYNIEREAALQWLEVSKETGLTPGEAAARLEKNGANVLAAKKKKTMLRRLAEQMSDFMILILLAAAMISSAISLAGGKADFIDPIIILSIVVLNAVMGIVQETRAERALESLGKLSAPKSTVLRGGLVVQIATDEVVCGDIILFETGDRVTADARLLEASALRVEESSLTGESAPVDKSAELPVGEGAPLSERVNMLYSGSTVVGGRCRAVVTAIGMDTEVGKIARLLDESESPQTPLQKRLENTGKVLGIAALAICAVIFVLGVAERSDILESFMLAVSLAVAAVPEGLPAIVTIVLALGVQRMAAKNAIVRRIPAVETLGAATVICSDKTGTLTQNKMTVHNVRGVNGDVGGDVLKTLCTYAALCTNSRVEKGEITGDPTENAIVAEAIRLEIDREEAERSHPRLHEFPFDSSRKLMTTVHGMLSRGSLIITKGAPDVVVGRCTRVFDGIEREMSESERKNILHDNSEMARSALRVIAVAYRHISVGELPNTTQEAENELVFLGLIGMIDPPRPEARDAVAICKRAGIRPVMITGDYAATAEAVARELGILSGGYSSISGAQLDDMDDAQLRREIEKYAVFARVTPEHKNRVVRALQANGEVVAMTGDGVNDAPALKIADIGCAMGKSGTDVARDASDMILTDDNFSTIVSAVREGRGIYDNICKTVHFLLSCNVGEILTILVMFLLGRPSPLVPIQLLWINLVTDSLPALALGSEPSDRNIMERPPINPKSSMFGGGRGADIIVQGLMVGALALTAFEAGYITGDFAVGSTCAFAVLGLSQLVHAFNVRSEESVFKIGVFQNRDMVTAFLICAAMQISVICIPALSGVFGSVPLDGGHWALVAVLSTVPLAAVELGKFLSKNRPLKEKG